MKKNLIALLLVVALVVTVSVFTVSAEDINFAANDGETVNGYCQHCKTNVDWVPFDQTVLTTGHYYLSDASLTEDTVSSLGNVYNVDSMMTIAAGNEVCLHLNGNTVYRSGGAPFSVSGTLAVMDHEANEGMLRGRPWTSVAGGCIGGAAGSEIYIYGGTIQPVLETGRTHASNGCCISQSGGYLEINGGTITGGKAANGGNIYLGATWSFKMTGGTISGGIATTSGGNIYLAGKSGTKQLAEITGGTITGGTATTSGGNIYAASDAEVSLTNCLVTLGTANAAADTDTSKQGGGNIFHSSGAHTIVGAGAVVSNGTATGNGGNFCQVYGGTLGHSGVHVKDGGKVLGGTAAYGGSISSGNNGYVTVENGGLIDGGVASTGHGGNIFAINTNAINVNAGGTISNGDAKANQGGNIYGGNNKVTITVNGGTVTGGEAKHGGNIMNAASNCYLTSGTVSYGTTTAYGGNVYNMSGKLYIQGATVTNGSGSEGGNVYQSAGTTEMTSGTLTLGSASNAGGNLCIKTSGGSFTFSGGTISKGTSEKTGGGAHFNWGTTLNMSGDAKFEDNTATTDGGNIYATGTNLQITGGTISGGTATGNGGNIVLSGSAYGSVTGATITGGTAKAAGNIYYNTQNSNQTADANRAAGVVLGEGTTISGGTATGFGGNIYINHMYAILTLDGVVLDGAEATAGNGDNIGVWNVDTLHIKGNTVIKNGNKYDSVYLGDCDDDNTSDTTTFNLKVTLDGKADVDYIYFSGYPADGYELCGLTIKEGYEGAAKLVWQAANLNAEGTLTKADFRKANTVLPTHVTAEENYANAATLYVLDNSNSQKPIAYFDTNADEVNELATTGMVGVDADGVEHAITAMPTDDTYAYVKLYAEGATIELVQDVVVDVNNMDAHFVTGDNKLTVVNYRHTASTVNANDKLFTVDKAENLVNLTAAGRNPVTNNQYIIIPEADNKYSAHQVKVDIDSVSIKPVSGGIYYTTNIATNAKVAPYAMEYGVVLSLAGMPGADFVNDETAMFTSFDLAEEGAFAKTTNSCLLTGILVKDSTSEYTNAQRGVMPIYATAYMCVNVGGEDIYVMADKSYELSLLDILTIVNDTNPSHTSVLTMYENWQDPMLEWATVPQDNENLPRLAAIKAAYDEANA